LHAAGHFVLKLSEGFSACVLERLLLRPSRRVTDAGAASKADCPLIHLREDRDAASTVSTHDDSKLPFPPLPAQKAR
jgi:hypothetical protein